MDQCYSRDYWSAKNTWCYHIEASSFDKATAYAVFDGHTTNDKNTYCYKTTDMGKTWTSIVTDEIYGFARSFQEDYENPDLLFLGTEFGLYVTINGGKNWLKFTNNMPATAIHYIEMHKKTNDLVLGTHGRGVIIIDDISPLRQISNEILSEKVHFMSMEPFVMPEESTFGGTSKETQFVGANPSDGARIVYFLPKRHTFGKMTMKVVDEKNNFICNLDAGKKKGLNIVNWYFGSSAPKVAKGKTFSFAGMITPRVPAGKYKVLIQKGKEEYSSVIDVAYSDKSLFTVEEREKQRDVTMQLYKMTEDLAYIVYELDAYIEHAQTMSSKNPKMHKSATKLSASLNTFKETLVVTTGDNYVGQAENELREDMGELFGTIAGYYGAPSKSQMENFELIDSRMNDAFEEYQSLLNGSIKKYNSMLDKLELSGPKMKSQEEFVKKN